MESLLKEALKCLCGENRWTYAIFWKIGCNNPSLLVWEDYHYESRSSTSSSIPGSDTADLFRKGWEGMWNYYNNLIPQAGGQGEDKVGALLNKMMLTNHVHVVGQGIVGRAAFTDFHVWILQENILRDQYPSEIWAEMHHQISAGMQTVAAIPVLPHGVVQLGSALTIMENMGFINDVKSLFAQLGASPAGLSTDYYTKKDIDQIPVTPPLFGIPISADSARSSYAQTAKFTPFISTSNSQEMSTSQPLVFTNQHSGSFIPQNQVYGQRNVQARASNLSLVTSKPDTDLYQLNSQPVIKPHLPLSRQLGTRTVGAQVILPSQDACSIQHKSLYESTSKSNAPVLSDSPFNSLKFIEQPITSSVGLQELVNGSLPASNSIHTSQLRSCGDKIPSSVNDSVIVTLLSGNQPPNTRNLQMASSLPYTTTSSSTLCVDENKYTTSSKGLLQVSNERNLSNNNCALPGVFHQCQPYISENRTNTKITKGKQAMENDMSQSLDMPVYQPDDHIPRSGHLPDSLHDTPVSNSEDAPKHLFSHNVISDDSCMQLPSGDDLFDMLGLDFKSNQLYGSWNNFLIHEEDVKTENASIDADTCVTRTEAVNDSISESGIFNGIGSDNLLDAVVSRLQSSAKQNSDYDSSCWTGLTKMGNSSVVADPLLNGRINVPDQKQVQSFGFPSPLAKSQITGSNSLRNGCSFDNTVESSQLKSMYGSQISSLCEDGQTMKHESSISTAHSKRPDDTGKSNRKRLRPGENPRPRPKDRQMIQDRVKELREIVPNGAKCSIDALLERTIKHMLFLQSVTKHADKLKNTGEAKIIGKNGGFLLEDNLNGRSTFAYEVGSQSMAPIIVEDLNTPRHMRVEMLCEEQGFFLEIADIIRGLGLTILKGVMEARNDKIWVHFTVEANRDVTKMEIFLSLVHLLEQATKSNPSTSKVPEGINMGAHSTFQPASIPVTGCGL